MDLEKIIKKSKKALIGLALTTTLNSCGDITNPINEQYNFPEVIISSDEGGIIHHDGDNLWRMTLSNNDRYLQKINNNLKVIEEYDISNINSGMFGLSGMTIKDNEIIVHGYTNNNIYFLDKNNPEIINRTLQNQEYAEILNLTYLNNNFYSNLGNEITKWDPDFNKIETYETNFGEETLNEIAGIVGNNLCVSTYSYEGMGDGNFRILNNSMQEIRELEEMPYDDPSIFGDEGRFISSGNGYIWTATGLKTYKHPEE